jgi:hypothetical protein
MISARELLVPVVAAAGLVLVGCSGSDTNINTIDPSMAVTPEALEFGEAVVGEAAAELVVTVVNTGRGPLEFNDISLGTGDGVFSLKLPEAEELLEDEQAEIVVSFEPTDFQSYTNTLVLTTNDPDFDPTLEIPLTGEGIPVPEPVLCLDQLGLDFGDVSPGGSGVLWVEARNCGNADLTILDDYQSGSGAFVFSTDDPVGQVLQPETDAVTLLFTYLPTDDYGDSGVYTLVSDGGTAEVTLTGNGGGDGNYPVALIDCPDGTRPLDEVTLDGSGSYDSGGLEIISYTWELSERPDASQAALVAGEEDWLTELSVDAAGDFTVQLTVTNSDDVASAPATCRLDSVPQALIHVELSWNTGDTDLDLHMLNGADAAFYDQPDDVCWCNRNPDWGQSGITTDDPSLEQDNQEGYGPESVAIYEPGEGEYYVSVHYYDDGGGADTEATVAFYLNGFKEREVTQQLVRNDVWEVGYVRWPAEVVVLPDDDEVVVYETDLRTCY